MSQLSWPRGGKPVYVHNVTTSVRKLYRCQVVIVRHSLSAPLAQARYWASSDLEATSERLLTHISARWDIEVLFADGKEELGLDHYQLMSAQALLRFWTLAMLAYVTLRGRAASFARRMATPSDHRRSSARDPASPSSSLA